MWGGVSAQSAAIFRRSSGAQKVGYGLTNVGSKLDKTPYEMTLAEAEAASYLVAGDVICFVDRAGSLWDVSSSGSANGFDVIYLTASGLYATLREAELIEAVFPSQFGFRSANTHAQNKAAIVAAIASLHRPGIIILPAGIFNVDPDIELGDYVIGVEGQGKYATALSSEGGSAFFYSDSAPIEYMRLSNFGLFNSTTPYGYYSLTTNHSQIENVLMTGFTSAAIRLGGYSNDIVGCDLYSNSGSGIHLSGTLNDTNIERNRVYANSGIGVLLASTNADAGLKINIERNAIEQNAVAGIVALNTKALSIKDNYFERNSASGYAYANPESLTVCADIHLLSDSAQTILLTDTHQNKCPTISGNHTTPNGSAGVGTANLDGFIFTNCPNNLTIENNQIFDTTKVDSLVCLYANRAYSKVENSLKIRNNSINSVGYVGTFDANNEHLATTHLIDIEGVANKTNYADKNFLSWGVLAGSTGTLVRSANFYNGQPSFQLTDGDTQWGKTIDLTVYQELRGKWVYFGAWVNDQGNNTNIRFHIDGQSSRTTIASGGFAEWSFQSTLQYIDVAATSLSYGIRKIGTGGAHLVNNPIFAVVGDSYDGFPTVLPVWAKTAAPTTGTWVVGDRVLNSVPTVGQPKSWVCTVAGMPGTWVGEGNL